MQKQQWWSAACDHVRDLDAAGVRDAIRKSRE
jgi:hypothetical protein